jgi:predicted lipoprotein with Yx(FWY)xxD motif
MLNPRWGTAGPIAVTLVAMVLTVSACGGSHGSSEAGGAYGGYGTSTSSSSGGTMAQTTDLRTENTSAGTVLATSHGMTLYYYSKDKPGSGTSACAGGCASVWPPLTGTARAPAGVTLPGPIGSITRRGGVQQVTVNGFPVYTYAADKSPGQVTGNGVGGKWHVIKLSGGSGSAGGLMKAEVTSAGKVLANPHGMTVYYYSKDRPGSGTSACTGTCARKWLPVIAPVRIPAGMTLPGPLGSITLPGGKRQVTINGYPIYKYAGDKAPGQASGNGIKGEWHVIKLTGSGSGGSGSGGSGSGGSGSGGGYGY